MTISLINFLQEGDASAGTGKNCPITTEGRSKTYATSISFQTISNLRITYISPNREATRTSGVPTARCRFDSQRCWQEEVLRRILEGMDAEGLPIYDDTAKQDRDISEIPAGPMNAKAKKPDSRLPSKHLVDERLFPQQITFAPTH